MSETAADKGAEHSARMCGGCGYVLDGLPGSVCPECGMPTASPSANSAPLGARAATGFVWMSAQSIATRVLTLGGQVVLAKLLFPEDFGLFALAMGVVAFVAILQQIGVREILVARQKRFDHWANAAMWITIVVAAASVAVLAASAPLAAWYYKDPRLLGLLLVLAASQPLYGLTIVHEARLQIDMRFKALAMVNLVQGALVPVLMVACALLGAGVYSFVLPRLLAGVVRVVMLRAWVRTPLRREPQARLWKYILVPGLIVLLTAMANTVASATPALILGKMRSSEVAGYFAFAFNITLQGVVMLATTLDNVMFPTLGRLQGEPERQKQAYLRATRALAAAIVPMCVLQALVSRPLVLVVFGDKWEDSIPIMQILSIGMIYLATFIPAASLLMAHSRFKTRLAIGVFWAVEFLVAAIIGAYWFGAEGVAVALGISYLLSGIQMSAMAMQPIGGGWLDAVKVLLPSHAVGLLAAAAGIGVGYAIPGHSNVDRIAQILGQSAIFSVVYGVGLRMLTPVVWHDLVGALSPILRRVGLGRFAAAGGGQHSPSSAH